MAGLKQIVQDAIDQMHRGEFPAALASWRKAVEMDPEQADVYRGLSEVQHRLNNSVEAARAYGTYLELSSGSVELSDVMVLRQLGDLKRARVECGRLLAKQPDDTIVLHQFALIAAEQGRDREAERLLLRMVELAPESVLPLGDLAGMCSGQHRYPEAVNWYEKALKISPETIDLLLGLGHALTVVGRAEDALQAYNVCLEREPHQTTALLGRGHSLRSMGLIDEAITCFQLNRELDESYPEACWNLASIRAYKCSDKELTLMLQRLGDEDLSDRQAACLEFAVAKAHEDRAEFDTAWEHYLNGNSWQRGLVQYDGVDFEVAIDTVIETYSQGPVPSQQTDGAPAVTPIFIVGMPRSGSTLLEQILASHSMVEATTELPYLRNLARRWHAKSPDSDQAAALAEEYLALSQANRRAGKSFFIDKLPDNFPYVGFIYQLFPHAVVIDARRHPLDTCVANFRQLYGRGKDYSYDLLEMAEMYLQYARVMDHWDQALPGKVLRVRYEDVVRDTRSQVALLLEHCGLDWEDACLDFHNTKRVVTTASAEQVRLPIYSGSVGYWQNFENELTDLKDMLGPLLGSMVDDDCYSA